MTDETSRNHWRQYLLLGGVLLLVAPILFLYLLYVVALEIAIWCVWLPRGRDVLFVYSNSPYWKVEIERDILPLIQHRAVVLNWSERAHWRRNLASMAFHRFGGVRGFNPLAVVFRPFRRAQVFRFWQPFRDAKHGNRAALERLKGEFLSFLGVSRDATPPQNL